MRSLTKVNESERSAWLRKVGVELRAHRERRGVNVENVYVRGRSRSWSIPIDEVVGLEAGRHWVSLTDLFGLCEFLDVDMWGLLCDSYRYVLCAKGQLPPSAFEKSPDVFGVAMAYLWVGLPTSTLAFVEWCCRQPLDCVCGADCSCACEGCHLSRRQRQTLLRMWRPRPSVRNELALPADNDPYQVSTSD
ncbi:hypothetical protein C8D88_108179 [Lentzea atacamensis]|uniref:Uncharacterized protein n=1 Tax=Lentzea atacamensis TaxID=531938 RepID=A0A316HT83_9PSEU|nr:hypothetical protein C8D88_108179 [Lentzea atacamensis]